MTSVDVVPEDVWAVCEAWFDGDSSVMHRIARRHGDLYAREFNLKGLLRELTACINACKLPGELSALEKARSWCFDEMDRENATVAIRRAATQAKKAGLSLNDFYEVTKAHWYKETPARQDENS